MIVLLNNYVLKINFVKEMHEKKNLEIKVWNKLFEILGHLSYLKFVEFNHSESESKMKKKITLCSSSIHQLLIHPSVSLSRGVVN